MFFKLKIIFAYIALTFADKGGKKKFSQVFFFFFFDDDNDDDDDDVKVPWIKKKENTTQNTFKRDSIIFTCVINLSSYTWMLHDTCVGAGLPFPNAWQKITAVSKKPYGGILEEWACVWFFRNSYFHAFKLFHDGGS